MASLPPFHRPVVDFLQRKCQGPFFPPFFRGVDKTGRPFPWVAISPLSFRPFLLPSLNPSYRFEECYLLLLRRRNEPFRVLWPSLFSYKMFRSCIITFPSAAKTLLLSTGGGVNSKGGSLESPRYFLFRSPFFSPSFPPALPPP